MSGHDDSCICPNCGGIAHQYTDRKPFNYTSIDCLHCGLYIYPVVEYYSLEILNERRDDDDLKPLDRLPNQNRHL